MRQAWRRTAFVTAISISSQAAEKGGLAIYIHHKRTTYGHVLWEFLPAGARDGVLKGNPRMILAAVDKAEGRHLRCPVLMRHCKLVTTCGAEGFGELGCKGGVDMFAGIEGCGSGDLLLCSYTRVEYTTKNEVGLSKTHFIVHPTEPPTGQSYTISSQCWR